jgi:hypothetical protein
MDTIRKQKVRISGGNLPSDFKAYVNLEITVDITREQELDCIGSSLVIDWQKIRDTAKPEELRELEKQPVKIKASEILAKKPRTHVVKVLTPEEYVNMILAKGDKKEIAELMAKLNSAK